MPAIYSIEFCEVTAAVCTIICVALPLHFLEILCYSVLFYVSNEDKYLLLCYFYFTVALTFISCTYWCQAVIFDIPSAKYFM